MDNNREAMYRRWRPQSFRDVVGQEHVTRTISSAVTSGRVAHAYMFSGPRGTGKTSMGRLLAKAVNCSQSVQGEPCNFCDSCKSYLEGSAIDLVEMDAASNRGIDEIRRLRDRVSLAPMSGRYKVYLIDEVHMLTQEASNALLKTLEEPPPYVIFVLATTEPEKVLATVISRCQRFDFRRLSAAAIRERLEYICQQEGIEADPHVLIEIGRCTSGSLRDAINMLEQLTVQYGARLEPAHIQQVLNLIPNIQISQLAQCIIRKDLKGGLEAITVVREEGNDLRQMGRSLVEYLRGVLLTKAGVEGMMDVPIDQKQEMLDLAASAEPADLVMALRTFAQAIPQIETTSSLSLDLALAEFVLGPRTSTQTEHSSSTRAPRGDRVSPNEPKTPSAPKTPPHENDLESIRNGAGAASGSLPSNFLEQLRMLCKDADKQIAALMNGSCELNSFQDDVVTLGFYFPFHKEKIESPLNMRILEESASRLIGRTVTINCVLTQRERNEAHKRGGHLLQAAREMGARPLAPIKGGEESATPDEP